MEKFNFFKNFKNSLIGGHDEKKIIDLYESDNFKQKIFFEKKISKLR